MESAVVNTSEELRSILESAENVAIVGCSDRPSRTSYAIYTYLRGAGFNVLPVNPNHDECGKSRCYSDLLAIPDDVRLDIINIFRNPRYTGDMVELAIRRAEKTGERPVIWTQIGVSSPKAEKLAREAGLPYVKNRCTMVEHSRMA